MQNDQNQRDTKDDDYRDDANEFGASSDLAQGRPVGNYTGEGPAQGPYTVPEKGSQDWQRGVGAAPDQAGGGSSGGSAGGGGDGQVVSRSADPGQSSYGGFKGEGPVPEDVQHRQAAALRDEQQKGAGTGGIATSNANLGASLPDPAAASDTQTGESGGTVGRQP